MKALLFMVFWSFCAGSLAAQSSLPDLKSLDELQKQFSADADKVRLIALLSPT